MDQIRLQQILASPNVPPHIKRQYMMRIGGPGPEAPQGVVPPDPVPMLADRPIPRHKFSHWGEATMDIPFEEGFRVPGPPADLSIVPFEALPSARSPSDPYLRDTQAGYPSRVGSSSAALRPYPPLPDDDLMRAQRARAGSGMFLPRRGGADDPSSSPLMTGGAGDVGIDGGEGVDLLAPKKPGEMGTAASTAVQKDIIGAKKGFARLARIQNMMDEDPDVLTSSATLGGNLRRKRLELMDYINPNWLAEGDRDWLGKVSKFRMNVLNHVNLGIKELTGAQMSEAEADRIMGGMPNINDVPTVFKAKMDESMYGLKLAEARAFHWASKGLPGKPFEQMTLFQMEDMLKQRGAEIYNSLISQGVPQDQAADQAAELLSQEFGL